MSLTANLTRIRRFLRDPDANIWTDEQLRRLWNDAQAELAQKTGFLERVDVYQYPARFTYAYLHDWEAYYGEGDRYQALTLWQADGKVVCTPWEPTYWHANAGPADDGYRSTQPWESAYGAVGDPLPLLLHSFHHKTVFIAYDKEQLTARTRREVSLSDPYYRTRTGEPESYYPLDDDARLFAIYPRPPIAFDDWSPGDTFVDGGGIVTWSEGALDTGPFGVVTETLTLDDTVFIVYQARPTPIDEWTNSSDWPAHLLHYVEMGTLERAFGADTDGFIPSLRDYWKQRKEMGINVIKRAKRARTRDRIFAMRAMHPAIPRRVRSGHPSMPSNYPGWA